MTSAPLVGVIVSTAAEQEALRPAFEAFRNWDVPLDVVIAPAELIPQRVGQWAAQAAPRGLALILAGSGANCFLPLLVASYTSLPVIAVQTTTGLPFGNGLSLPAIHDAAQAALFALRVLANRDARWSATFTAHRQQLLNELNRAEQAMIDHEPAPASAPTPAQLPRSEPPPAARSMELFIHPPTSEPQAEVEPISQQSLPPAPAAPPGSLRRRASDFLSWIGEERRRPAQQTQAEPHPQTAQARPEPYVPPRPESPRTDPALPRRPYLGRIRVNADFMPVEVVEQAVQCLATGGIVALPTDTVYGLAIDATHVEAARRLYALKERSSEKSLAIFIDSQRLLTSVVGAIEADVRNLLEAFWPGPLTVVFEQRSRNFAHLASGPTIGIRIPDHSVPLTLMQELRRPLACTSANPSGLPEARSADEVEEYFGRNVDMILDAGRLAPGPASTVIDVTNAPFRIIRDGAISRAQLAAVVGDLIQS